METRFKLSAKRSIITYDLETNDVTASDIAKESPYLFVVIRFSKNELYHLPSTTIKADLGCADAKSEFLRAFHKTKSQSKIKRMLICEIKDKDGYIFEDE